MTSNPEVSRFSSEHLKAASADAMGFLRDSIEESGRFRYKIFLNRRTSKKDEYNLIRHAGVTSCLFQNSHLLPIGEASTVARRSLQYISTFKRSLFLDNSECEAVVDDGVAKLGASALTLLATIQYFKSDAKPVDANDSVRLGNYLISQQEDNGHFHSLHFVDPLKERIFESLYYPGEAILALAHLAHETQLDVYKYAALRGALFLANKYLNSDIRQIPHDHWLMIAIEVIDRFWPNEELQACAFKIASSIKCYAKVTPDGKYAIWGQASMCSSATRAEGLGALIQMAIRNNKFAEIYLFYECLEAAVEYCLLCQVTAEGSTQWQSGKIAVGGFIKAPDKPVIRMDFVQHGIEAISALVRVREALIKSTFFGYSVPTQL